MGQNNQSDENLKREFLDTLIRTVDELERISSKLDRNEAMLRIVLESLSQMFDEFPAVQKTWFSCQPTGQGKAPSKESVFSWLPLVDEFCNYSYEVSSTHFSFAVNV